MPVHFRTQPSVAWWLLTCGILIGILDCGNLNMMSQRSILIGLLVIFLGASSFSYRLALPNRKISFPQDHFSHPDFRTEWWYYTGHLETDGGRRYGYQVTFFRYGLRDRQNPQSETPPMFTELYMAHFALSDKKAKRFVFRERVNRGHHGKAGASATRYLVWNEDWKVELKGKSHMITVKDRDRVLRLRLTPLKPPVLHGQNGLSQKGEGVGRASHYYSLTRLRTEGEIEIGGQREKVRGLSWMDHEFGSDQLGDDQVGWDWFSLQLGNQAELMLYLIRRKDDSADAFSSGTLVYKDGTTRHLPLGEFRVQVLNEWKSPRSGSTYPMGWQISIPAEDINLEVVPEFPAQELDTRKSTRVTYWEGAVQVQGAFKTESVEGVGYVEMTGYASRLKL